MTLVGISIAFSKIYFMCWKKNVVINPTKARINTCLWTTFLVDDFLYGVRCVMCMVIKSSWINRFYIPRFVRQLCERLSKILFILCRQIQEFPLFISFAYQLLPKVFFFHPLISGSGRSGDYAVREKMFWEGSFKTLETLGPKYLHEWSVLEL